MKLRKQFISLLLVLSMLVGILPASALENNKITDDTAQSLSSEAVSMAQQAEGLYLTMDGDGNLSEFVQPTQNAAGVWGYFSIPYTALESKTVFYYQPNCTEFEADETTPVSAVETSYADIYAITLEEGCRGNVASGISIGNDGFPIVFVDGSKQLYWFAEGDYYSDLSPRVGSTVTLRPAVDGTDGMVFTDVGYSYTASVGDIRWDATQNGIVWDLSAATGDDVGYGWVCASKDGVDYVIVARLFPAQGDGGGNSGPEVGALISGSHATKPSDCVNSLPGGGGNNSAAIAFPYNGKTYYMGVTMHGFFYPNIGGSMAPVIREGEYQYTAYDIGFYVSEGDEAFDRIKDEALINELVQAFTTLEVKVWALDSEESGFDKPEVFPAIYQSALNEYCAACTMLKLGTENRGGYLITATGVLNGETYETYTFLKWDCRGEICFEPNAGAAKDVITQINEYLNTVTPNDQNTIVINMPAGTFEGYIEIPAGLGRMWVDINGSTGGESTTIRGGVHTKDRLAVNLNNINFVGNGKEKRYWTDGVTPNYAVYGPGNVKTRRCVFSGYLIALEGTGTHKSSNGSTFIDNGTAIHLGEGFIAGDPTYDNNVFRNNGIALHFAAVPDEHPMTFFDFEKNSFIDNAIDIKNDEGRRIFIPGCYFAHTVDDKEVVRECKYAPIGNQQGEGGGNLKKQVLYYPQAADPNFEDFIFNTNFYGGKSPIVSVNFTKTFLIPAGALDGATFTVMKHDELLARITFEELAATFALPRSMEVFDATVEVRRSEDSITVSLQEIPGGRTPAISVPCDAAWENVAVYCGEEQIDATFENGMVTFEALSRSGATEYRIVNEYLEITDTEIGASSVDVTIDTNLTGNVVLVAAVYENGKMVKVAAKTMALSSGTVALPVVVGDGQTCKVFLLDAATQEPVIEAKTP